LLLKPSCGATSAGLPCSARPSWVGRENWRGSSDSNRKIGFGVTSLAAAYSPVVAGRGMNVRPSLPVPCYCLLRLFCGRWCLRQVLQTSRTQAGPWSSSVLRSSSSSCFARRTLQCEIISRIMFLLLRGQPPRLASRCGMARAHRVFALLPILIVLRKAVRSGHAQPLTIINKTAKTKVPICLTSRLSGPAEYRRPVPAPCAGSAKCSHHLRR